MIGWLSPARWLLVLAAAAALVVGYFAWEDAVGDAREAAVRAELAAAAAAQTDRNRELQRAAELRYTVAAEAREKFITQTITEVRYATVHLAACPVGAAGVRMLNDAAACARGDSAAAGCAGEPVRGAP